MKFTNHNKTVLVYTKLEGQHLIVYWSLHDNVILSSFSGHKSRIKNIDANSSSSTFVSVDESNEARVWDYNTVTPIALFTECVAAIFDNTGKVLACQYNPDGSATKHIYLYNAEESSFDKPFSTLQADCGEMVKFSYDGKYILTIEKTTGVSL